MRPVPRVLDERKWTSPRWRFGGRASALVVLAAFVLDPARRRSPRRWSRVLAVVGLYVGVIVCLRASGLLVDRPLDPPAAQAPGLRRLRRRWSFGCLATARHRGRRWSRPARVDAEGQPATRGCNGYIELCLQPIDQVVWPASHNAMSSSAYNFLGAEHTITIPEQLNAGARFLMLDAYYGYDDNGLVRTNLAGGVDRKQLEKERGKDAVRALDRLGALTGTADTSGKKQDVYFCHDFCELGAVKASDVLAGVKDFLDRNLTEVVVLDFEDYVQPKDLHQALDDAGLLRRLRQLDPDADAARPRCSTSCSRSTRRTTENPRRLIVVSGEARRRGAVAPEDVLAVPGDAVHVHVDQGLQLQAEPRRRRTSRCCSSTTGSGPTARPIPTEADSVNSRKVAHRPVQAVHHDGARGCRTRSRSTSPRSATSTRRSTGSTRAVAEVTGATDAVDRAIKHISVDRRPDPGSAGRAARHPPAAEDLRRRRPQAARPARRPARSRHRSSRDFERLQRHRPPTPPATTTYAFGEVLADEAVPVLVRAALPG